MSDGLYKMRTIAEATGFNPALLRAWERRHGLLLPERTDGGHRLYTEDDLKVLRRVRQLLDSGRAIGEIASLGRDRLLGASMPGPQAAAGGELEAWRVGIVSAAVELDEARLQATLDEAFAVVSAPVVIGRVVEPALREIGRLWSEGRCSVAGEHLASSKVMGRLLKLIETSNPAMSNGAKPALCACLPDEQHEIGSLVAAYTLTRYHYRVAYLGASMPLEDLERSCRVLAPKLVCLSVTRPSLLATHQPKLIEMCGRLKRIRFLIGGHGIQGAEEALTAGGLEVISGSADLEAALTDDGRRRKRSAPKR